MAYLHESSNFIVWNYKWPTGKFNHKIFKPLTSLGWEESACEQQHSLALVITDCAHEPRFNAQYHIKLSIVVYACHPSTWHLGDGSRGGDHESAWSALAPFSKDKNKNEVKKTQLGVWSQHWPSLLSSHLLIHSVSHPAPAPTQEMNPLLKINRWTRHSPHSQQQELWCGGEMNNVALINTSYIYLVLAVYQSNTTSQVL